MSAATDFDTERKAWTSLVARCALKGWQLWRSDATDGPQRYFLGKWGHVRAMASAEEVDRVLDQAGLS